MYLILTELTIPEPATPSLVYDFAMLFILPEPPNLPPKLHKLLCILQHSTQMLLPYKAIPESPRQIN